MGIAQESIRRQYVQPSANAMPRLRPLMIRCPVTGRPADTGFEMASITSLDGPPHLLLDCLECGQDHLWTVDDVLQR